MSSFLPSDYLRTGLLPEHYSPIRPILEAELDYFQIPFEDHEPEDKKKGYQNRILNIHSIASEWSKKADFFMETHSDALLKKLEAEIHNGYDTHKEIYAADNGNVTV